MPYKHDPRLKIALDELDAEKKAKRADARRARAAALMVAEQRKTLKEDIRLLSGQLDGLIRRRIGLRGKRNLTDAECETVHGQVWRDLQASIDQTYSSVTTARIRLELFNQDHHQCR